MESGRILGRTVVFSKPVKALAGEPADYLTTYGCRPNPGPMYPVVLIDDRLIVSPQRIGTNHRAAYAAIDEALAHARNHRHANLRIHTTSELIYTQLKTRAFCDDDDLGSLSEAFLRDAKHFDRVEVIWVTGPFVIAKKSYATPRLLRNAVEAAEIKAH